MLADVQFQALLMHRHPFSDVAARPVNQSLWQMCTSPGLSTIFSLPVRKYRELMSGSALVLACVGGQLSIFFFK